MNNTNLNKTVFHLDKVYKPLIRKICMQGINLAQSIPLEWEDLYWDFLYHFAKIKTFDPEKNITFATFIGLECKNFVRNKIKLFSSKKHHVLNTYIQDENQIFKSYSNVKPECKYVIKLQKTNYINSFKGIDKLIVNEYFINNNSLLSISEKTNIKYSKIRRRATILKLKIKKFLNN